MYDNIFLIFNYDSAVKFKVVSSLNTTTQPIAATKNMVGPTNKPSKLANTSCLHYFKNHEIT